MLSDEQITKFQMLYRNRFGKEINRNEAYEKGVKLMRLVELIYKPMTKDDHRDIQKKYEHRTYECNLVKTKNEIA